MITVSIYSPSAILLYRVFRLHRSKHRALAIKLKLMTFSWNQEIRLSVYQRSPPCLATRNFFCCNSWNTTKCCPGKEIFQSMILYYTNKSPMRNIFFFIYHKLGWDMVYKNRLILSALGQLKTIAHWRHWMFQWLTYRQFMQICHVQYYFKYNLNWTIRLCFISKKAICNTLMQPSWKYTRIPFRFASNPKLIQI